MPGIVGFQETWLVGSRFYFKRNDTSSTVFPTLDLGSITQATPNFEPTTIAFRDPDGGRLNLIDEAFTDINESYSLTCGNINQENLNVLFYGEQTEVLGPTSAVNDAGRTNSDVRYTVKIGPGKLIKLESENFYHTGTKGQSTFPAYNVSNLTGSKVGTGTTTLTVFDGTNADTADVELVSAERGIVRFFSGGTRNLVEGDLVDLSYIEDALETSNTRLVKPQTLSTPLKGRAYIVFSRNNNERQSVREFECALTVESASFSIEDYSNVTFSAAVLTDINKTNKAGRYMLIKGDEIPLDAPGS